MLDYNLTEVELYIDIFGPNSPYSNTWEAQFKGSMLIITYACSPLLVGGIGESIRIQFADVEAYMSENLIPITSSEIYLFEIETIDASATSESASSGASYTFIVTMLLSFGVSMLTGGSMELMWSLANTLQVMFFFSMMKLYYSSDLKMVFAFMSYSNFDNPATKYLSKLTASAISLASSPVNTEFSDVGFGSTDIISNSLDKLFIILCIIIL